jgi:hypothetical protein
MNGIAYTQNVMPPVKQAKNKRENVRSSPPPMFELSTSSEQVFCSLKIDGENQYCNVQKHVVVMPNDFFGIPIQYNMNENPVK